MYAKGMANLDKQYLIFMGKKIREYRDKMGVSQEQLGKIAKLHRTYIGMIERGEKNMTVSNMRRVAHALKVKVRDLIDF